MGNRHPELFEMRRLEQLSNTIFGVAMTLLAYDLPRGAPLANPPGWAELYHLYASRLIALALSFVIAGIFWFSHHRRLALQPEASRGVVFINLIFLLSIILLPASNGLYGNYGQGNVVAMLYGLHLTIIAGLNAWLWWLVSRDLRLQQREFAAALFPLLIFVPGIALAGIAPRYAPYFWSLAFGGLVVRRFFGGEAAS
jgi:uncharacterized membrane protein